MKRHQIALGLIPPPNPDESTSDASSNFSLEIEMLNKLHVEKNNPGKLSELPVIY
jgi:hypothetical protein